jgi:hypothetical protein
MTHERVLALLDDHVGGELSDLDAAAVRRHLAECGDCRREADALAALVAGAAALPRGIAPPRDLWGGIAARLEPRGDAGGVIPLAPRRRRPLPAWLLAAAAVLLVVASSLATLQFAGRPGAAPGAGHAAGALPPMTALAWFQPLEREYARAIDDLYLVLDAHRGGLAPETVAALEENLRAVDEAIRRSRAALEADPASREVAETLSTAYETKLEFLERAVQL